MPLSQASEMVQRSSLTASSAKLSSHQGVPPAIIGQHDRQMDQEAIERIASLLQQQLTPLVAIETLDEKPWAGHPRHQSEALLGDITGVAHLFGGEAALLQAAEQLLVSIGLRGRMAIADSVGAAWGLSHYVRNHEGSARFIAPPGVLQPELEPLVVESLRLAPVTVATLARLGVTRIDQLLRLPRSGLAPRLGNQLVDRIAQALGEVDEPLLVHRVAAEHRETHLLQYPTSDQRILEDRVQRLVKKVRAGLATRQRGALRVTCRLDLTDHPPLTFEIGLFAPTIDVDHLRGLITNRLESLKLPSLVERLTLEVTLSGPLRSVQTSLFDDEFSNGVALPTSMSGSNLSRLIDSLSGRLGRDAVVGVRMEDDPLPEKAFTALPMAGNRVLLDKPRSSRSLRARSALRSSSPFLSLQARTPKPSERTPENLESPVLEPGELESLDFESQDPSPRDPMRRPCSLLAQAIPLAVAFGQGPFRREVTSPQLPSRLQLAGVVHAITAHWGPERIETGWWHGPSIRRDYYRIETDQGRWWWIFRNLRSRSQSASAVRYCWMLHGRFD